MKPAVWFAIPYTLGILCVPREIYLLFGILVCAFLLRRKFPFVALSLLFFVLGGLLALRHPVPLVGYDYEKIWRGEMVRVSGVVEGVFLIKKYESPWEEDKIRETSSSWFQIHYFYKDEQKIEVQQRVLLSVGEAYPLFRGQTLEVLGQMYTLHQQLHLKIRHSAGILKASSPSFVLSVLMSYQEKILKLWEEYFPLEHNAIYRMLLFGEKRQEEFLLWFYRAGNAHLLAISGLHLYLMFCFLARGLKILRIHQRWIQLTLGTLVLTGLFLLVQFSPSMSRTALLFLLVFLGKLLKRGTDSLNLSAVVFMGMLAYDPTILGNAGFQLTFSAFVAIIVIASKYEKWFPSPENSDFVRMSFLKKMLRFYVSGIFFSLAIQSVTTPILMYHFHQFYLWEALTGPLFILPFQALLFGLFGMLLGVFIFPEFLMQSYCILLHYITDLFLMMVQSVGSLWGNHQFVANRPAWIFLIYFIPLSFLVRRFFKTSFVCFMGWLSLFFVMAQESPSISFLNVGQGNVTLIQQENKVILYDAGSMNLNVLNSVVQSLWKRGVSRIDQCIISHGDADHYNLLVPLSRWITIQEILVTQRTAEELRSYWSPVLATGTKLRILSKDDQVFLGKNLRYQVLAPSHEVLQESSRNNASLVLQVWIKKMGVVLTGDIEQEQINRLNFTADITLLPHHGSRNNNLQRWKGKMGKHQIVSCDYWFNYESSPERSYTFLLGDVDFHF